MIKIIIHKYISLSSLQHMVFYKYEQNINICSDLTKVMRAKRERIDESARSTCRLGTLKEE